MSVVNLNIDQSIFSPKFFPYLFDYSHRWEIYKGSAGSGKSYFITQKLLLRALKTKIRILVCRRYGTTLRQTVFSLFKQIITQWQLTPYVKINETDFRITFCNGSEILFIGLDNETKLLSLNDISCVWVEEAYEVPRDMVEQLNLRMRGKQENQQIILSFNPISKHSYLFDMCEVNPPKSCLYLNSTFRDNPFLSTEYVSSLEELYVRNPAKARIYCDGDWGVDAEGLVFSNWEVRDFNALELAKTLEHRAGMDIGFQDPTAIIDTLYDDKNHIIYVSNEFYARGQQLDEIYSAVERMLLTKTKMYCDSADARAISFLKNKGANAKPCIKGAGSVEARISFLQNHKIIVSPNCSNLIMELENFAYEKDKQSGQYTDKTTHEFSHAIDALGYAYSDIYTRTRLGTIDKGSLGI